MAHKVEKQRQGIQSIEVGTRLFCATRQRALACRPQKHIASLSASRAPGLLNKTVIFWALRPGWASSGTRFIRPSTARCRATGRTYSRLQATAEKTHTSLETVTRTLENQLAEIRLHGIARASGTLTPGINGLSAPVFDHTGRMIAAITSLGTTDHLAMD